MQCGWGPSVPDDKKVIRVSMLSLQAEFVVNVKDAMEEPAEELDVRLIVNEALRQALRLVQQIERFIPRCGRHYPQPL